MARIVVPGLPHHVMQRGNRREPIFFAEGDQGVCSGLLAEELRKCDVEVWAYCLMPNHVHLVLVPKDGAGLSRAIGAAHHRYTHFINARGRWTGHLFQSRFASVVMNESHLLAAVRYVSLNPVRARMVMQAQDWPWSSVRAHLKGEDDGLLTVAPVLARAENVAAATASRCVFAASFCRHVRSHLALMPNHFGFSAGRAPEIRHVLDQKIVPAKSFPCQPPDAQKLSLKFCTEVSTFVPTIFRNRPSPRLCARGSIAMLGATLGVSFAKEIAGGGVR